MTLKIEKLSAEKLREEYAYTIGTAAFIWGLPSMELYRVGDRWLSQGGKVNTFQHACTLFTPEVAGKLGVVWANTATLYSLSWLDLSIEPIVVDLPPIKDRYFTINYIDSYQEIRNISNNTTGRKGGSFAFSGPNWNGPLPQGLQRIEMATNTVWIIGRTEVKGQGYIKKVHAIQDQYQLTTLSEWVKGNRNTIGDYTSKEWPPYDDTDPLSWLFPLGEGLKLNPPPGDERGMLGLFKPLGIGPDVKFNPAKLDQAMATGLRRMVNLGPQLLTQDFNTRPGTVINSWQVTPDLGSWVTPVSKETDFMIRVAIAKEARPGKKNAVAVYLFLSVDGDGNLLSGCNNYVLRFQKGDLPPIDAFWSITLYVEDGSMIPGVIRNQISTYDGLHEAPDGSVAIDIQHESSNEDIESNWLPAPQGGFTQTMRLYNL